MVMTVGVRVVKREGVVTVMVVVMRVVVRVVLLLAAAGLGG